MSLTIDQMSPAQIVTACVTSARSYGKLTFLVRHLVERQESSLLGQVADKLSATITDEDKDSSRPFVSFKSVLSREGKTAGLSVSCKKIEGGYVVVFTKAAPVAAKAVEAESVDEGSPSTQDASKVPSKGAQDDAVQAALAVVLANLSRADVLAALKAGLSKLAE